MIGNHSPRTLPIHPSFLQPLLIMGAERELVIVTAVLAAMLIFSVANLYLALLGLALWIACIAVFQRVAKADPQMSRVYVRHARYRRYYPACAHASAPFSDVKDNK